MRTGIGESIEEGQFFYHLIFRMVYVNCGASVYFLKETDTGYQIIVVQDSSYHTAIALLYNLDRNVVF